MWRPLVLRFVRDENGQDLIEYALLAAFIGAIGALAWQGVRAGLGTGYGRWDSGTQSLSSCTPDPGGGSVGCGGS